MALDLGARQFRLVICDESHSIKDSKVGRRTLRVRVRHLPCFGHERLQTRHTDVTRELSTVDPAKHDSIQLHRVLG